ncbi:MAG: 1-deoxy-D-xylulose-5-phosphate synthase [Clostridium sp.]|nr:1-deoxy-D-xylulose-5-phosphate synthase [Clostridium sp.]MCM1547363.1 1-deoxy-D-xylulose-5-phosphate synthase [Ruminococcus sp.]
MKENNVMLDALELPGDLKKLDIDQCKQICGEIREVLVETVSKNGGHLASNLGVVELTMAIHRNFSSPEDKIVWDVGHQSYTHKILTGRLDRFSTLRKENGISGFTKPEESEHDAFISGHSSTSVSAAFGIAKAMKLDGKDENYVVAVTGDGAMTGGMVYEGLNNAGKSDTNLIVIVNHNDMSISKNVGALAKYLLSIRTKQKYLKTKRAVEKALTNTPVVGKPIARILKNSKDTVKSTVYRNTSNTNTTIFEDLGFIYLGPVNGHDIAALDEVIMTAKSYHKPVVIHVNTVKGKGYEPAEKNPGEFHGISKFDIITGNPEVSTADCYSTVFGKELLSLAKKDERICAVTAAMKYGTGLQYFCSELKERFFDAGIAEQHAVTFCAGLASAGKLPVFAVYSSFLQRAVDQMIHDVVIGKNHVVIGIDRAGIVGEDGETHQGVFDVPIVTSIPGAVVYSPSCYEELKLCLNDAIYKDEGLACVRYPRGNDCSCFDKTDLNTSHTLTVKKDSSVLLITYGRIYDELYKAHELINESGTSCDLLKLTRIFPISRDIVETASGYEKVIFFEESGISGGIAEHLSRKLLENGFKGSFYAKGITGLVKQASVKSVHERLNFECNSMTEYIRSIAEERN